MAPCSVPWVVGLRNLPQCKLISFACEVNIAGNVSFLQRPFQSRPIKLVQSGREYTLNYEKKFSREKHIEYSWLL
jgi:hypothetical protein